MYHDPAVLEREKQVIFGEDWLCIARAEEIANPGDYKTFRIVEQPVLLCRTSDGRIAAYSNTCLHRGVEVASGAGNTKEFTCPYHGWLYNLDGQLMGAPYMRDSEGFDRKNCKLPELPCETFQGWVFVSLNKTPEKFETFVAEFAEKFGYIDMEPMRLGIQRDIPLNCNWKLMVENFIDFYHIGVLHKDTIGRYMKTTDVPYETRKRRPGLHQRVRRGLAHQIRRGLRRAHSGAQGQAAALLAGRRHHAQREFLRAARLRDALFVLAGRRQRRWC